MAAGRTITQRIALDGGAQIKTDLDAIGKAAQAAFDKFAGVGAANNFLAKFGTSVDGVTAKIAAMKAAGGNVGGAFDGFRESVGGVATKLSLAGIAAIGVVGGFAAMIKSAGEAQEQLQNMADTLGVSAEKLQALQDAAEVSGIGSDQLNRALTKLVGAMNTANQANVSYNDSLDKLRDQFSKGKISYSAYQQALSDLTVKANNSKSVFKDLGVSITNDGGKSLRSVLDVTSDLADGFKNMDDGTSKASASLQLFGTRNAKVVSLLNGGSEGLKQLTLEAERLAPALDKRGRAALDAAADSFTMLGKASEATKNQILAVFAPDVTALVQAYTNSIANGRATWVNYAKTIEAQVRPVVQDIIALIEGRPQDVKNSFVLTARDAVIDFGNAVKGAIVNIVIPAFNAMLAIMDGVANAINAVFGTKLTGGQLAIAVAIASLTGIFGALGSAVTLVVSVIGFLVTTFGGAAVAAAAAGAAIGFLLVKLATNLGSISNVADRVFKGIPILAQGAVNLVIAAFQGIGAGIAAVFNGLVSLAGTAWNAIASGVSSLASGVVSLFTAGVSGVVALFAGLPAALAAPFTAISTAITAIWTAITSAATDTVSGIVSGFLAGVTAIGGFFSGLLDKVKDIFKQIVDGAAAVVNAISGASGGNAQSAPQFASGGAVRGPGGPTSDSIFARISNGEFIQRAAAVKKYGLAFMSALNQGRISADSIRNLMSGVDVSGLTAVMPGQVRFATGGLATVAPSSSKQPVHVHLPGAGSFPLEGDGDVVKGLVLAATRQKTRSAGRKPQWYGAR